MSLNYSINNINDLIKESEVKKRYFEIRITPRFSDCIYDRKIPISKFFEFFEIARFDIMHNFCDYYQNKNQLNRNLNLGNFVVVRIQNESYETSNASIYRDIIIKTALIVHQKPLLEFEQIAFEGENNLPLMKANIKIVIVDDSFEKVENWDNDILLGMLEFIDIYGREK